MKKGFTIVELLVVIVVIAILAAITTVAYNGVTNKAYESSMKQELLTAATQLALYNQTSNSYPVDFEDSGAKIPSGYDFSYTRTDTSFCTALSKGNVSFYITQEGNVRSGDCTESSSTLSFALGSNHTLALSPDGVLRAWGRNDFGELGNGTTTSRSTPVIITNSGSLAGKTITQIAAGNIRSFAIASDGSVHAWGGNSAGQLGDGTTTGRTLPVEITNSGSFAGKTITQILVGGSHNFAIASDGTVHAWGDNYYGPLGDGTTTSRSSPAVFTGAGSLVGKTITKLVLGSNHTIAIASDNTVHAWGHNDTNQLGDGTTTNRSNPVAITSSGSFTGKTITQIITGGTHSLALATDGTMHAWGYNGNGQLGDGTTANKARPVAITSSGSLAGKTVTQIAAGSYSLALATDGTMHAWGYNASGQVGDGTIITRLSPVAITNSGTLAGKTITKIKVGHSHSLTLASDNTVHAWGYNGLGQLGDGTTTNRNSPMLITLQ